MKYMEKNFTKRFTPALHLPGAKSVILLGANYYNEIKVQKFSKGISIYARGKDYHLVLKDMMRSLVERIKKEFEINFKAKLFVDSSPLLERALARRAGLGWIGKNSCLLNKVFGSWIFLCGMIIDIELEYDKPYAQNHCGRCRACIEACPTGAIIEPYVVDSRLCISYHTIENKGDIPKNIQLRMNGWIFGCDICQQVCPWNRRPKETKIKEFLPDQKINSLDYTGILNLDESEFKRLFSHAPIKRAGLLSIKRNVNIALGKP